MVHIQEIYPEIEKRGAHAVVVLAQSLKPMMDYLAEHPFPFPVLSDVRRAASKAYGVYVRLNLESVNMARPACFTVDTSGVITYAYVGSNQSDFPPDREVLDALDNLKA